jgi:hypothetical protein
MSRVPILVPIPVLRRGVLLGAALREIEGLLLQNAASSILGQLQPEHGGGKKDTVITVFLYLSDALLYVRLLSHSI